MAYSLHQPNDTLQWKVFMFFLPLPGMQTALCVYREDHVVQVRVPAVNQDVCPWDLLFVTHVCEEGRREDWRRETADMCASHV